MLGLPKTTEFNKRIPKEKFYENLNVTTNLKKCFVDQIKVIYWRNKIAASTTNLAAGKVVTEIEIFEVKLKTGTLDETVLRQIDKEIPYHIIFLLEYENRYQAWTAYKEVSSGNNAFKVNQYYHTEWLEEDMLPMKLEGMHVDAVYENFVYQIAGKQLQPEASGESLKETIAREGQKQLLQKQIDTLKAKIRKEKQLNKQMQMNTELKKLKKELEVL